MSLTHTTLLKKSLGKFKDRYVLPCYLTFRTKATLNITMCLRAFKKLRPDEILIEKAMSFPITITIVMNIAKRIVKG